MTRLEYFRLNADIYLRNRRVIEKYDSRIVPEMLFFFDTLYREQMKLFVAADVTLRYNMPNPQPGWRAYVYRCGFVLMGMKFLMRSFIRGKRSERDN